MSPPQTPAQRNADAVLDLIDGAMVGDVSEDAMRWTSNPQPPPDFAALAAGVRVFWDRLVAVYRPVFDALGKTFADIERAFADAGYYRGVTLPAPRHRRPATLGRAYARRVRARRRRA